MPRARFEHMAVRGFYLNSAETIRPKSNHNHIPTGKELISPDKPPDSFRT